MKLKRLPEDFRVEELPTVRGGDRGRFAFYRLWKRGLGTPEAIEGIRRRWNLSGAQIHYGGLKDRHAETVQYLTILDGPDRPLRESNLDLEPLGRLPHPYGPAHFRGNRFDLTLRDLGKEAADRALEALAQLPRDGLPNYFDDQRFGSVGFDGGFIAEAWLKGDHETAFRLGRRRAQPVRPARRARREAHARRPLGRLALRQGRSAEVARPEPRDLPRRPPGRLPGRVRPRPPRPEVPVLLRVSELPLEPHARPPDRAPDPPRPARRPSTSRSPPCPCTAASTPIQAESLATCSVPLPASRTPLEAEGPMRDLADEVLSGRGLTWEGLRVKHLKDVFFSRGLRPALFFPGGLSHRLLADDIYPGRKKLMLGFDLPKGAYATLVVKRVTEAGEPRRA